MWVILCCSDCSPLGEKSLWNGTIEHHGKPPVTLLYINSLRPRQNGRHFADDVFKCIFLNENVWILLKISRKFVPKGPINNIPSLVQIMAWRRPGDKPLSESMMDSLLTHICVARPQWVNRNIRLTKHQKFCITVSLWENHLWWVDFPHKGPVMQKVFSYHNIIMDAAHTYSGSMGSLNVAYNVDRGKHYMDQLMVLWMN